MTLIGRPHLDLFDQEKLIPANIDMKLKLIPNTSAYHLETIAPDADHPQINYKVKLKEARLFILNKHF